MSDVPFDPAQWPRLTHDSSETESATEEYVLGVFGVWIGSLTGTQLRAAKEAMRRSLFQRAPTQIDDDVVEIVVPCSKQMAEEMFSKEGMRINGRIKVFEPKQKSDRYIMYFMQDSQKGKP